MTSGKTSATGILCDRIVTVSLNWYALSSFGMYFYYYCTQCITYPIQLPTTAAATTAMATIDSLAAQNKCCAMHTLKESRKENRFLLNETDERPHRTSIVWWWWWCDGEWERETMALLHKTRQHKNRPSQLFSRRKESSGQVASTNKCFYSNSLCVICLWTVHVDGYIPSSRMTAAENRNERFIAFAILWKEY